MPSDSCRPCSSACLVCSKRPRQKRHWTLEHFVTNDHSNESSKLKIIISNTRDSTWNMELHGSYLMGFWTTFCFQHGRPNQLTRLLASSYGFSSISVLWHVSSKKSEFKPAEEINFHQIALILPNTAGSLIEIIWAKWIVVQYWRNLVPLTQTEKCPFDTKKN